MNRRFALIAAVCLVAGSIPSTLQAQAKPAAQTPAPAGRTGTGKMDPADKRRGDGRLSSRAPRPE